MELSITTGEFDNSTIHRLTTLFRDGNDKLQQHAEKGILLLGNAGVGKSTFAHIISGRKLQAVLDEDTNQLIVEAVKPLEGIVIEHKSSETKIVSKCHFKDLIIWEFPGFDDSDPVDEISKIFYVKRLFEIMNQLKFILLVSESDLRSKKGFEFLETVSNFIKLFKDVDYVKGSVSLVITKVSKRKSIQSIRKSIDDILSCNQAVTENVRAFISEMKFSALYLFHEPSEERMIVAPDLERCIDSSGKYVVVDGNKIDVDVSAEGRALSSYFLRTICNNFTRIILITLEAICDATRLYTTETNVFSESHHLIKDWIPSSFRHSSSRIMKNEHFPEIGLLSELKNILSNKVSDISDVVRIIQQTHEILLQYTEPNSRLHREIQEYSYCLQQQYGFMKYFSTVYGIQLLDHNELNPLLKSCYEKTKKNLEHAVVTLCIYENKNEDYYYQAIEILENYRQFPDCMKQLEVSYRRLADVIRSKTIYSSLINALINITSNVMSFLIIVPRGIISISYRLIRHMFRKLSQSNFKSSKVHSTS